MPPLSRARARSLSHGVVQRTRIGLACADGQFNDTIVRPMGLVSMTVGSPRRPDRERSPKPCVTNRAAGGPVHEDERAAGVIDTARQGRLRSPHDVLREVPECRALGRRRRRGRRAVTSHSVMVLRGWR